MSVLRMSLCLWSGEPPWERHVGGREPEEDKDRGTKYMEARMDDGTERKRLDRPVLDESVALTAVPRAADTSSLTTVWKPFSLPAL